MHDISLQAAIQAFNYWKRHYSIISMQDYLNARNKKSNYKLPLKPMVLTLDDGHKGNYQLISLIKALKIPVTIFLCSGIVGTNRHFWFLQRNLNIDKLKTLSDDKLQSILSGNNFYEKHEYNTRQALSDSEISEMKRLSFFDLQSHTEFHPVLTKCSNEKAFNEIDLSKITLKNKYKLNITGLAYPNGDYNEREVVFAKKAGYKYAVTTNPGYNSLKTDLFKLKRLSVNDSGNLDEIIVKSSGVWWMLKKMLHL